MQISKTALFGGAMLFAGIAHASMFEYTMDDGYSAYAASITIANGVYTSDSESSYSTNPNIMTALSYESVSANASVNAHIMSAYAYNATSNDNTAFAVTDAYVSFTEATDVQISWDFTNGEGVVDVIDYDTNGDGRVFERFSGSGTEVLSLQAGRTYVILLQARVSDILHSNASASVIVVPAPGAAALAGLAGIAAVRRRR